MRPASAPVCSLIALLVAGCRTAAAPSPAKPVPPPTTGMEVQKLREDVQVTPWEVVFSGVRGVANASEVVSVRNVVEGPVVVRNLALVGEHAATFSLRELPPLPAKLEPRQSLTVELAFAPAADAAPGVHRALLRVQTGPSPEDGPAVDVAGLVTQGEQGENEPPLQQALDALGFSVDVGGTALRLGTDEAPIGDEVKTPLFQRAKAAPVAINPVARFSPDEPLPFGHYRPTEGEPKAERVGVIAAGQAQTLNPELEADSQTSFDPGDATFGIWVKSGQHTTYTEDHRNTGPTRHAARVYPLKARGGALVPNAYVVAFEEAANGDYQDYVFLLWNVRPASPK